MLRLPILTAFCLTAMYQVAFGQVDARFVVKTERKPNYVVSSTNSPWGIKLAPELRPAADAGARFVGLTSGGNPVIDVPFSSVTTSALTKLRSDYSSVQQVSTSEPVIQIKTLVVFWGAPDFPSESILHGFQVSAKYQPGKFLILTKSEGFLDAKDLKNLAADPRVRYVEPNYPRFIQQASSNDPYYTDGSLWGLKNINSDRLWSKRTATPVVVAVIDTGIDPNHSDLQGNVLGNGFNFISPGMPPTDDNGHGTHVAGVIGAKGNNGVGVVGVAWEIRLLPLKVFPGGGKRNDPGFDFDVVKAIDYAISAGAKIINNSWAGKNFSLAVKEAITRTERAGILFVAACANHNQEDNESDNDASPRYPASYGNPNIIAVHSIDPNDDISLFSNFGRSSVHIGAPGASILSTAAGGGYETRSGTSQAAPHISGAAALLWALPENAGKSASEIKALVLGNARRVNSLAGRSVTGATLDVNFVSPGSGVASMDLHAPTSRRIVQQGWVEIRETTEGRNVMFNGRSVEDTHGDALPSFLGSLVNEQLSIYRD